MEAFSRLPNEERALYFQQAADLTRIPAHLIEKDFWVCFTLRMLFQQPELSGYLTFKGGTSLSKVFRAIDRFSEDIDFAVSRPALGFADDNAADAIGISMEERKRRLARLMVECRTWTTETLRPALYQSLQSNLQDERWSLTSEEDATGTQQLLFAYPSSSVTIGSSYNSPRVRIELTARTDDHPSMKATIRPVVAETFPRAVTDAEVEVQVLRIERTFWEKATILHQFHFQSDPASTRRRMA